MVREEDYYEQSQRQKELERFIEQNAEFIKTYFKGQIPTEQQLVDALDQDLDDFLQTYEEEEKQKLEILRQKQLEELENEKERLFVENKKKELLKSIVALIRIFHERTPSPSRR